MRETIFNFMKLCFPGINGYPSGPSLKFYVEVELGYKDKKAFFFCIHRVTDLYNDEWEIKSDLICLILEGNIFILKDITTNYDQQVEFDDTGRGFNYDVISREATIYFSIKSKSGIDPRPYNTPEVIPRSKWQLIELLLEVVKLPNGDSPEKIRKLLIGEKFPIEIREIRHIASRNNDGILIPKKDVIETLKKSGKEECADYFSQKDDYIHFNSGCYKLL